MFLKDQIIIISYPFTGMSNVTLYVDLVDLLRLFPDDIHNIVMLEKLHPISGHSPNSMFQLFIFLTKLSLSICLELSVQGGPRYTNSPFIVPSGDEDSTKLLKEVSLNKVLNRYTVSYTYRFL